MSDIQSATRKRLVRQLAERDGFVCHYCGVQLENSIAGYNPRGASLDHVVPQDKGGSDDLSNLKLACRQCNVLKKTKHYQEFKFAKDTDITILFVMGDEL